MIGNKLGIGAIGYGIRGMILGDVDCSQGDVCMSGCADPDPVAQDAFKERFGDDVFITVDYKELLVREDIHVVFVLSPDWLHEEHAVAALRAGKHVYLDKPMAITIEGCDRILKAAYETGSKLFLGHNMRHMSFVLKMKELIGDGAIGEVKAGWCRHFVGYGGDAYFKDWHAEREKSTGLLLQKGAHDIDILHWLCNGYTQEVTAFGGLTLYDRISDRRDPAERPDVWGNDENWPPLSQKKLNPVINVEDINMMLMKLDNGVFASYQQCHYTPDTWRNYCIIGTEGRIENFGDEPGQCIVKLWNNRKNYNPEGNEQFAMPYREGTHGGADIEIVAEFLRYVRHGGKIKTSVIAARNSVAAGYLATQSLRNGGTAERLPPSRRCRTNWWIILIGMWSDSAAAVCAEKLKIYSSMIYSLLWEGMSNSIIRRGGFHTQRPISVMLLLHLECGCLLSVILSQPIWRPDTSQLPSHPI